MTDWSYTPIQPIKPCEPRADWHSVISIQLGELVEGGFFDLSRDDWSWGVGAMQASDIERVNGKIVARYYWHEIGIMPPGEWKQQFLRTLNEIAPKYAVLYKALAEGASPLTSKDDYGRTRDVYSDFPASQIAAANQDYASFAQDKEWEHVTIGDWAQRALMLAKSYQDIDALLLNELDVMFSCLLSVSLNVIGE